MLITVYVDGKGAIWALTENDLELTRLQFEVESADEVKGKVKEYFEKESE